MHPRFLIGRCILAALIYPLVALGQTSESESPPPTKHHHESFLYRKWVTDSKNLDAVVIALHGFNGASTDYQNLATHLARHHPNTALYAYELRGQGRHPNEDQKGDIQNPNQWSNDLLAFTSHVKSKHPDTPIIWLGESMGALIIAHTYHREISASHQAPCAAICLSSPVVQLNKDIPEWKIQTILKLSQVTPTARVALKELLGDSVIPMTHQSKQDAESAAPNPWSVKSYTFRHLAAIAEMVRSMPKYAKSLNVPTLILHGGHDFFSPKDVITQFTKTLENTPSTTRKFYPEGHHLLMYDQVKDQVTRDIGTWITKLAARGKLSD